MKPRRHSAALLLAWVTGAACWLCACASRPELPGWQAAAHPSLRDAPVRIAHEPPFAPRPAAHGVHTATAARLAADDAQARATALSFVSGLLDADAQALSLLLDDQVTLIAEGSRKARREVVSACLGDRRGLGYRQERRLDAVVDTAQLSVVPAGSEGMPRPPGTAGSDLMVQLVPTPAASGSGQRLPCLGTLYVRPGARPVVVAVMR